MAFRLDARLLGLAPAAWRALSASPMALPWGPGAAWPEPVASPAALAPKPDTTLTQKRSLSCGPALPASCFSAAERMSTPESVCTAPCAIDAFAKAAVTTTDPVVVDRRTSGTPMSCPNLDSSFSTLDGNSPTVAGSTQARGKFRISTMAPCPTADDGAGREDDEEDGAIAAAVMAPRLL